MNTGPGPGPENLIWDESTQTGFYGFVDPEDMFGYETNKAIMMKLYDDLYPHVAIWPGDVPSYLYTPMEEYEDNRAKGTSYNENLFADISWMKFRDGNRVKFFPRCPNTYEHSFLIYQMGAMFGRYHGMFSGDFTWATGIPIGNQGDGIRSEYTKFELSQYGAWYNGGYFYQDLVEYEAPPIPQTANIDHHSGLNFSIRWPNILRWDYSYNGVPAISWDLPQFETCNGNTGWGVDSEWNRLIYRLVPRNLIENECYYNGWWMGPTTHEPFAEYDPEFIVAWEYYAGFPLMFLNSDYGFPCIDEWIDTLTNSYHPSSAFMLECEIDMGSPYRKFWTGFRGTEESEVA